MSGFGVTRKGTERDLLTQARSSFDGTLIDATMRRSFPEVEVLLSRFRHERSDWTGLTKRCMKDPEAMRAAAKGLPPGVLDVDSLNVHRQTESDQVVDGEK